MKNRIKICLSLLLLSLVGCSTVENVNDVGIVSRNNLIECVRVDSVVLRDSVFIREKSDTVFYTKYRTVYKELLRVDTIVRCDTLYRDREVIVEREKAGTAGNRSRSVLTFLMAGLSRLLLWRTGRWRVLCNMVLKVVTLCKRIFRLKV